MSNQNVMYKGSCAGNLTLKIEEKEINLRYYGSGGIKITPSAVESEIIEYDAEYILVTTHEAVMMRLAEAKFWFKNRCILISSVGIPDHCTIEFLKKLVNELGIPAYFLVELNLMGVSTVLKFIFEDFKTTIRSKELVKSNYYWLGILSRDIKTYGMEEYLIDMEESELNSIKSLINQLEIQDYKNINDEIDDLLNKGKKIQFPKVMLLTGSFFTKYILYKIK